MATFDFHVYKYQQHGIVSLRHRSPDPKRRCMWVERGRWVCLEFRHWAWCRA